MGELQDPAVVLLVLDAQVAMLSDPPLGVPAAQTVRTNIAHVIDTARAQRPAPRIIHIRNCGVTGEPDEPRSAGWQLLHGARPGEPVLDKLKNNAFEGTDLAALVPPAARFIIVGCQSDYCVRATCSAALARGNHVVLVRGAHATYDRDEILEGDAVTPAATVESEIEAELEEAGVLLVEMHDVPTLFTER